MKRLAAIGLSAIFIAGFVAITQPALAQNIVTSSGVWRRSGASMLLNPSTLHIGSTGTPIAKGWFTDLDVAGVFTFGGTITGSLDLNGNSLIIDVDGNTSMTGDTDDQIDWEVGGADVMKMTGGSWQFEAGEAFTGAAYQIGRNADGTNQLQSNVPTGAGYEWSINDTAELLLTNTKLGPLLEGGLSLGESAAGFQNLFLSDNAVINWAEGGTLLTHSTQTLTFSGAHYVLDQGALGIPIPTAFTVTGGAHTGMQAATEVSGVDFDLSAAKNWSNGAGPLATQREFLIQAPAAYTGTAGTPLTITDAATLAITGAPTAGADMTFTNTAKALWVQSGLSQFDGDVSVDGSDILFTSTGLAVGAGAHSISRTNIDDIHINVPSGQQIRMGINGAFNYNLSNFEFNVTSDDFTSGGTNDRTLDIAANLNDPGASGGSDRYAAIKVDVSLTDTTGYDEVFLLDLQADSDYVMRVNPIDAVMEFNSSGPGLDEFSFLSEGRVGTDDPGQSFFFEAGNAGAATVGDEGGGFFFAAGAAGGSGNNDGGSFFVVPGTPTGSGSAGIFGIFDPTETENLAFLHDTTDAQIFSSTDSFSFLDSSFGEIFAFDGTQVFYAGRMLDNQGADVASANDLTLGADGNTFEITGTTQVNRIVNTGWQNGATITLLFTSTPTVKDAQATAGANIIILLDGSVDFVASAGDTLTLQLSEIGGTQEWREIGRSVL